MILLQRFHVDCRRAFGTLFDIETDARAFLQCLEAAGLNRAEVNKYVSAFIILYEPETFAFVEPFYFTFWHSINPPFINFQKSNQHYDRNHGYETFRFAGLFDLQTSIYFVFEIWVSQQKKPPRL